METKGDQKVIVSRESCISADSDPGNERIWGNKARLVVGYTAGMLHYGTHKNESLQ